MKKFILTLFAISALITSCGEAPKKVAELTPDSTPEEVMGFLLEGNRRFVSGETSYNHRDMEHVNTLTAGQNPAVAVIACSDSRVPIELLFDMGFGDVFVIRNAGNTAIGDVSVGSVDYALNHLGVKVILFLGHTYCGAITGVVGMGDDSGHHVENDENVANMLDLIAQEIEQHRGSGCADVTQAVVDNATTQANIYSQREFVKELIDDNKLIVAAAIYDLATGEVKLIE